MSIYRIAYRLASEARLRLLAKFGLVLAASMTLAACSTPLTMSGVSGFFAKSDVETTGSIPDPVASSTLPVLVGSSRWPAVRNALQIVLRESRDGDTVSWRDDDDGGSVTATQSYLTDTGEPCRRLSIIDNNSGAGELIFDACRSAEGTWVVEPMTAV